MAGRNSATPTSSPSDRRRRTSRSTTCGAPAAGPSRRRPRRPGSPAPGPGGETVPVATDTQKAPVPVPVTKAVEVPAPDVAAIGKTLTETYRSAIQYLTDIKDVPTAEAALPKVQGLSATLDTLKAGWDRLSDAAKASLKSIATENLDKVKDLVAKVLAIPGVGEKIKPALDALVAKLTALSA